MNDRRPHMPLSVKLEAAILQLGLNPRRVEYHHDPELKARYRDPVTGEYEPAENDPRYIRLVDAAAHNHITNTDNGTGRSSKGVVAHVRRGKAKHDRHVEAMKEKSGEVAETQPKSRRLKRTIPGRRFNGDVIPSRLVPR